MRLLQQRIFDNERAMKNVLIINPWIYDFAAYDYWLKPLGLLYLASYLRQNNVEVIFIDCLDPTPFADRVPLPKRKPGGHGHFLKEKVFPPSCLGHVPRPYHRYGIPPSIIREKLLSFQHIDLILVGTTMTYWYPGAWELIKLCHQLFPLTPVLLGGIYPTLLPEHALKSGANFVLPGPGEIHIPFIIRDLLNLTLSYAPDPLSLNDLPYPSHDLLPHPDQLPILTSRGCPYQCPYCASPLLFKGFIRRDPIKVVDEICWWWKTKGVKNFSIYDDAFLLEAPQFAEPMLKEIIRRGLDIKLHFPNGLHIRAITSELAGLLYRGHVQTLRLGLETGNEARQKALGGKVYNAEFEAAISYLHQAGYRRDEIGVYILCGLPDQEPQEVEETIKYVKAQGARPILAEYSPIPRTSLWEKAKASSVYPIEKEPLFQNNSLLPCWSKRGDAHKIYRHLKAQTKKNVENVKEIL